MTLSSSRFPQPGGLLGVVWVSLLGKKVKASFRLRKPRMALPIGEGQESLEGERAECEGFVLTCTSLPRD